MGGRTQVDGSGREDDSRDSLPTEPRPPSTRRSVVDLMGSVEVKSCLVSRKDDVLPR